MASPRVTGIIATYNWSTVLPYSIASALEQTFSDFELLVVGDGCTDDSEAVVAAIDDPRVRWINLPAHTGHQSGPNNRGLAEARGEFVAYLGHDDLWLPHHLACAVEALDRTGAALSHSIVALILPEAQVGIPTIPNPQAHSLGRPSSTVHRREMTERIGGWADFRSLKVPPEGDLWRRAQEAGFEFTFVPRLTAIKFPASIRRDVYRKRPSHEQEAWLARIRAEPNFEPEELVRMIVGGQVGSTIRFRHLVPLLIAKLLEFCQLFRPSALAIRLLPPSGIGIKKSQKFKGSERR